MRRMPYVFFWYDYYCKSIEGAIASLQFLHLLSLMNKTTLALLVWAGKYVLHPTANRPLVQSSLTYSWRICDPQLHYWRNARPSNTWIDSELANRSYWWNCLISPFPLISIALQMQDTTTLKCDAFFYLLALRADSCNSLTNVMVKMWITAMCNNFLNGYATLVARFLISIVFT